MTLPAEGRPLRSRFGDIVAHQPSVWPTPVQLCLPMPLMRPEELREILAPGPDDPAGVEPIEPPEASAALGCVARIVQETCAALGVREPRVRWYRPRPVAEGERDHRFIRGFYSPGRSVIWLNVHYGSPEELARTVAHEVIHYWQNETRSVSIDELERTEREGEAQRRALVIVPKGSIRMPRGKARAAWFEPV